MTRDGSSKRPVKKPKNRHLDDNVDITIKKKTPPGKGLGGRTIAMAMLAVATASTIKTMPSMPDKEEKKQRIRTCNSTNIFGNKRSGPNECTYKAVEARLRAAGLWNQAVAFHNALDLMEVGDLAFTRRRERIRMHRNEDGSIMRRLDGTLCECPPSVARP